jgi:XTP/dITP diphosphohydrolase
MPARVLLATRNADKLAELGRIVAPLVAATVLGLDDVAPYPDVAETGATFADNALLKAREAARRTGILAVADDSGLTVDALNGMPGVLSARWAGAAAVGPDGGKLPGADQANLELLLAQLSDIPDDRRGAAFVCAAALVDPRGPEVVCLGRMPGRVIRKRRGTNGFGYDPIFVPSGQDLTSAELSAAAKDRISHRGQALRALAPHLLVAVG